MNDKEELKQIYDIFTDCWRLYKKLYPPGRPEDDVYWQGVVKEIEVLRKNHHHSRLCEDLLLAVAKDLENKAKRNNPVASMENGANCGKHVPQLWSGLMVKYI